MNITLSIDERVADSAREAARKMAKSLNQAVRDYLEQLAGSAMVPGLLSSPAPIHVGGHAWPCWYPRNPCPWAAG